jgi:hypothetical protein
MIKLSDFFMFIGLHCSSCHGVVPTPEFELSNVIRPKRAKKMPDARFAPFAQFTRFPRIEQRRK